MQIKYNMAMKSLLEIAYKELKRLEDEPPCWETYSHIADLSTAIQYLEKSIEIEGGEVAEVLAEMRSYMGTEKTLDFLTVILTDFVKDMEAINPHLSRCFLKKLKENS